MRRLVKDRKPGIGEGVALSLQEYAAKSPPSARIAPGSASAGERHIAQPHGVFRCWQRWYSWVALPSMPRARLKGRLRPGLGCWSSAANSPGAPAGRTWLWKSRAGPPEGSPCRGISMSTDGLPTAMRGPPGAPAPAGFPQCRLSQHQSLTAKAPCLAEGTPREREGLCSQANRCPR